MRHAEVTVTGIGIIGNYTIRFFKIYKRILVKE